MALQESQPSSRVQQRFLVEGLTCASCASRVEDAVRKIQGVESVQVNLATGQAQIGYDKDQVSPQQLKESVSAIGYELKDASETSHAAFHKHQLETAQTQKRKLIVAIVCSLPIVVLDM